jgi:hypothetical protein
MPKVDVSSNLYSMYALLTQKDQTLPGYIASNDNINAGVILSPITFIEKPLYITVFKCPRWVILQASNLAIQSIT